MTSKINYYTSKNYNKTESNGEGRVKEYLDKNKIDYDLQVSFSGLKSELGNYLRYDFLIDHRGLLEIDGPQHFNKNNIFGESAYEETYKRDLIKNQYAESHGIPLFRIVYINNGFKYLIDELKVYLNMLDNKASTKEIHAKYLKDYTKKVKEQIIKNLHTNYKERNYCKLGMVRYNKTNIKIYKHKSESINGFKSDFNSLVIGYPNGINCRDINILNYLMYNVKRALKHPSSFNNEVTCPLADLYTVTYGSSHQNYNRNLSRLDYSLRVYGGNQNGSTSIKLAQISLNEVNKQGFTKSFLMFSEIEYSSDLVLHAKFNPKCTKYFVDLDTSATFYPLKSILEIRNKYAKILMPHLSQYRNTGLYAVNIPEMFNYFGLGNKITQSYLINKIIPKAMKALLPYFPQLHLTIYQRPNRIKMPTMLNRQGVLTNINYLCFTFKPHLKIGYHTENKALINIPDKDLITKTKALPFDKGIRITNKSLPF